MPRASSHAPSRSDSTTLRSWWKLLRKCSRECEEHLKKEHLMDLRTCFLLQTIDEEGPTPMRLASELHLSRPQVSRLLDDLRQKGWVEEERNPEDRRNIHLTLTPDGKQQLHQAILHLEGWLSGQDELLLQQLEQGTH